MYERSSRSSYTIESMVRMERSVSAVSNHDAIASPARSTVAVIGLGSIGGVAAGCLRDANRHDIVACARRPIGLLTLERPNGTVDIRLRTLTDPIEAEPVDWALL